MNRNRALSKGLKIKSTRSQKEPALGAVLGAALTALSAKATPFWETFKEDIHKVKEEVQIGGNSLKKVLEPSKGLQRRGNSEGGQTNMSIQKTQNIKKNVIRITKTTQKPLALHKSPTDITNQPAQERLKQINARKMQLLKKLKSVDAELQAARKQSSRVDGQQSMRQSNFKSSFISELPSPRNAKNESVVQQHSKTVEMLEKINNEKIKRQQKLAEQFRRKQRAEMKKIQELERRRELQIEDKIQYGVGNSATKTSKGKTESKSMWRSKLNLNSFPSQPEADQVMPTTLDHRHRKQSRQDEAFFSEDTNKHLLTERDDPEVEEPAEQGTQNIGQTLDIINEDPAVAAEGASQIKEGGSQMKESGEHKENKEEEQ